MSKLWIYGCSHSIDYIGKPDKWWGGLLSERLGVECMCRGLGAKAIPHIFDQIVDDVYDLRIDKNDIVILNTSYLLRYTVPHIYIFNESEKKHLELTINNVVFSEFSNKIKLSDFLVFNDFGIIINWYHKTRLSYDLLSKYCDNVYQWTLEPIDDINFSYDYAKSKMLKKEYSNNIQPGGMTIYNDKMSNNINEWKNLILPPVNYNCWDDEIKDNLISSKSPWYDGPETHQNEIGHQIMSDNFYNFIINRKII